MPVYIPTPLDLAAQIDPNLRRDIFSNSAISGRVVRLADPAAGTDVYLEARNGTTAAKSNANEGRIRYNTPTQKWQVSANGGVYVDIATGAGTSWNQGGNAFGALGVLGTTDDNDLSLIRNSVEIARLIPGAVQVTPTATTEPAVGGLITLGTVDPLGRIQIWHTGASGILRLGADASDGDPCGNVDSEGIVIYKPSDDAANGGAASRIKADRFGLTRSLDTSYYFIRVDRSSLFYRDNLAGGAPSTYRLYVARTSAFVGIGSNSAFAGEAFRVIGDTRIEGAVWLGCPAAAPADATLQASQVTCWVDEVGKLLTFKVKYADGVTVKSGTVALLP